MARKISFWVLLLLSALLVGCDHATKLAASSILREPITLFPHVLDLQYTENHDVAFSLLRAFAFPQKSLALVLVASIGSIFVASIWWKRRHVATRLEHIAWSLTFAGAFGNLLDRIVRGYVIDFIYVHHWPVFNVADILVVCGVLLLLIARRKVVTSDSSSGSSPSSL